MESIEIDGHVFQLLRDRDQGNFFRLSFAGKITYLEARVDGILISPCRAELRRALQERTATGLILVTAVCAGISAAGTFLKGSRASRPGEDKSFFVDFITAYMAPVLTSQAPPRFPSWADWLYKDVRCGLAHNFAILTGGMKLEDIGGLVRVAGHGPEIHTPTLLEDFASGWARYLADVRASGENGDLGQKFKRRFDRIFRD
jgi:hypothetical protein